MFPLKEKKIVVTGGAGFLGTHLYDTLIRRGVSKERIFVPRFPEYDLRKREDCERIVKNQDAVLHLAGHVGGIGYSRQHPGELFYDNLVMGVEMLEASRKANIEKFVAVGSVCSYPKLISVPAREEDLWNGYPEETNAAYGLAKKMLLVGAQAYHDQYGFNAIALIQVNLYGPGDNFDPVSSHVIPALIRKVFEAKSAGQDFLDVWGTGSASREFLYVEDAAEGIVLALENYNKPDPVNLGSGTEISIKDLVKKITSIADFRGEIRWDPSKPDGQPRRLFDVSRAKKEFGFQAKTTFDDGLRKTIEWYAKTRTL